MNSFGGFFAKGGTLQPGQWGIAGERGPEPIFAGSSPLTVHPNVAAAPAVSSSLLAGAGLGSRGGAAEALGRMAQFVEAGFAVTFASIERGIGRIAPAADEG